MAIFPPHRYHPPSSAILPALRPDFERYNASGYDSSFDTIVTAAMKPYSQSQKAALMKQ